MALPHPPIVHPAHASPAVSHHPPYLMQQPGQPGQPGMPMQYAQYANVGVVRPPQQPGMSMAAMTAAQQQAAMIQQRQMAMSQQQQQQLAQQSLQQQQQLQAQAQAAQQAQAQAQAAAQAQAQAQAAARPMAGHMSASPHLQHFTVNGPAGAMHPQHHYAHQTAGVGMTPGPRPTSARPARPGPVRPPGQAAGIAVQQHPNFQQHPGIQQPGQQPGQVQHPPHAAGQMTPQSQQATPVMQPGSHPQQTGAEHQMAAQQQAFNMSRAASVQSQMGQQQQPTHDAESLLKIYVHDYLARHELPSTANAMRSEGGIPDQQVPITQPKGALSELWSVFWELATAGKPANALNNPNAFNEAISRIRGLRASIATGGPNPQPGQQFQGAAAAGAALTRAPSQQQTHAYMAQQAAAQQRQQQAQQQQQQQQQQQAAQQQAQQQHAQQQQAQQAQQQAAQQQQASQQMGQTPSQAGMSPAHVAMQAQHQQQQQQAAAAAAAAQHQAALLQQQAQAAQAQQQAAARFQQPGPSGSPAQQGRPPPGQQHAYQAQQAAHMGMQPPNQGAPNHASPVQPSPRMAPQHAVMPSPLQKPARPPNGIPGGTPTMMHAGLSQQGVPMSQPGSGGGSFMNPPTPQAAASPAHPMTPQQQHGPPHAMSQMQQRQQQLQQEAQQKQAQAAAQMQQQQQQLQNQQQQMSVYQQQQQQQQQAQALAGNGPHQMTPAQQMYMQHQQSAVQAAQQQQQHFNVIGQHMGLGNVNADVMNGALQATGLMGRDFRNLPDHEKAKLRADYTIKMQELQRQQMNGTTQQQQQPPGGSPATTPQFPGKAMGGPPHAQQQGMQRQVSGTVRRHDFAFDGAAPMQAESSQSTTRDNTPPERKRQRRNSGSAAPSPYITPQSLQPGFQQPQQPGMVMQQQMQMMAGRPGGMPMNGGMEGHSPVTMPGQSPRTMPNGMPGQSMQRNQSKSGAGDGSMPPPQSPAGTALGRKTPQSHGVSAMTPKMQKEEAIRDSVTPKSLRNSPNNNVGSAQAEPHNPSPPTATPGGEASSQQQPQQQPQQQQQQQGGANGPAAGAGAGAALNGSLGNNNTNLGAGSTGASASGAGNNNQSLLGGGDALGFTSDPGDFSSWINDFTSDGNTGGIDILNFDLYLEPMPDENDGEGINAA